MEPVATFTQDIRPSAPQRISFGRRLGAYCIDLIIATLGGFIIGLFAGPRLADLFYGSDILDPFLSTFFGGSAIEWLVQALFGSLAAISLILLAIMLLEAFTGQTPGKMILAIKNGNEDGKPATLGKLFGRAGLKYIGTILAVLAGLTSVEAISSLSSLLGFVIFIGCFFVLAKRRQAFHDMIAKTAVYFKSDLE